MLTGWLGPSGACSCLPRGHLRVPFFMEIPWPESASFRVPMHRIFRAVALVAAPLASMANCCPDAARRPGGLALIEGAQIQVAIHQMSRLAEAGVPGRVRGCSHGRWPGRAAGVGRDGKCRRSWAEILPAAVQAPGMHRPEKKKPRCLLSSGVCFADLVPER